MTTARRIGAEDSATRAALLDAAQALMVAEGYAAVSSRKVAARAGLKPQLVHYYFRTMDDLFIEVFRRRADANLERVERAVAADGSLSTLWRLNTDPTGRTVITEMAALANHRKDLRTEIAELARTLRTEQIDALVPVLDRYGISEALVPESFVVLANALGQVLVMEGALGLDTGHAALRAQVEDLLTRYEGPRR